MNPEDTLAIVRALHPETRNFKPGFRKCKKCGKRIFKLNWVLRAKLCKKHLREWSV